MKLTTALLVLLAGTTAAFASDPFCEATPAPNGGHEPKEMARA